jgi:hypothetical protein
VLFRVYPLAGVLWSGPAFGAPFFWDGPMKFNEAQKVWLGLALAVLLGLLLFPPWLTTNYGYGGFVNTTRAGHASLWADQYTLGPNSHLDFTVLACELLALGVVTAFLVYCSSGSSPASAEQHCVENNAAPQP